MRTFAAYVGWDWAEQEHELRIREVGSERIEQRKLAASPEALHGWAAEMRSRFGGGSIGVCIETSRGAVIWALMGYEHIVLYPVNPKSITSFREAFYPSGKKDDAVDAEVQLELIEKHRDKLRQLEPADPETRSLGILSEHRRKMVHDLVRETNRLRTNLRSYFPQALELVGELDTVMACDFLDRWWSLASVQRAREATVRDFYRKHASRSKKLLDRRLELLHGAVALTSDEAIVTCGIMVTRSLVRVIRALIEAIAEIDDHLQRIYSNHLEHDLLDSFPGLGPILGARVAALLGSDRDRFDSRESLQLMTGIAPITKRTGGTHGTISVHRRVRRSKFLHQTIVEWAAQTIHHSTWARAFYDQQRDAKGHWSALRALGYKWLRILFRAWKDRQLYNETTYLESLAKRGSPLLARLNAA